MITLEFRNNFPRTYDRKDSRVTNASSLNKKLGELIEKLKKKEIWGEGQLDAMVVLRNSNKKIVLTALHAGNVIEAFQSNDYITVEVLEGELKFKSRKNFIILEKDQFLTFHDNLVYSLSTKQDTIFLLTIYNNTYQTSDNNSMRDFQNFNKKELI